MLRVRVLSFSQGLFSCLTLLRPSFNAVKAQTELSNATLFACFRAACCNRASVQRHVEWKRGVSSNLFPMTQMKSWEQPGCWQASDHASQVPLPTSSYNCDLCKHQTSWMTGLCTLSRNQNTETCFLNLFRSTAAFLTAAVTSSLTHLQRTRRLKLNRLYVCKEHDGVQFS